MPHKRGKSPEESDEKARLPGFHYGINYQFAEHPADVVPADYMLLYNAAHGLLYAEPFLPDHVPDNDLCPEDALLAAVVRKAIDLGYLDIWESHKTYVLKWDRRTDTIWWVRQDVEE